MGTYWKTQNKTAECASQNIRPACKEGGPFYTVITSVTFTKHTPPTNVCLCQEVVDIRAQYSICSVVLVGHPSGSILHSWNVHYLTPNDSVAWSEWIEHAPNKPGSIALSVVSHQLESTPEDLAVEDKNSMHLPTDS